MSSPDSSSSSSSGGETAAIAIAMVVILVKIVIAIAVCQKCKEIAEKKRIQNGSLVKIASPDFRALTMDNFLNDMEREKPIRFTLNSSGLLPITSLICWAKEDLVQFIKEYLAMELL
ncbi:hypothetical protein ACFX13_013365 [Malus domestica]